MARSTNSLFCLPLNPTVTFLPIRHFFVCAGDYAFKSPVGRSNVAVRSSEIAATLLTFPLASVAALRSLIVAAVNKEEALILQFAWSLSRILPVVRFGNIYFAGPAASTSTRSVINLNQMWTPLCAPSTK
ncbi:unnamed protein product [Sphagnum jensenii]|uniref:Uncharacterized protein n=1 Tax=Sphagnum jensenii TaxID=128206 RepID=A0ABP0XE84_9BRYO